MSEIILENTICPCGSKQNYTNCCDKFISGSEIPATPEQLMRSRYSAYTKADINYIFDTMREGALKDADRMESMKWAKNSNWLGLEIVDAPEVSAESNNGEVEFIASYEIGNQRHDLKERSKFKRINDRWYYVGAIFEQDEVENNFEPIETVRVENKIGRNDPCSCGSGKKYKKCCLN